MINKAVKYFDTLNHEILINLLRRKIKDERVVQLIKRYLKSGIMENGVVMETEEGSPQGGNLSPLLANIYLNEFERANEHQKDYWKAVENILKRN